VVLLLLGFLGVRLYKNNSRMRWVREQVLPELARLSDSGNRAAAFSLMRHAEAVLPGDPALQQARHVRSFPMTFQTNPPGADVWVAEYGATDDEWLPLGKTPFTSRELPFGYYSVRVVKPGFEPILGAAEVPGPRIKPLANKINSECFSTDLAPAKLHWRGSELPILRWKVARWCDRLLWRSRD
jgi:hypothetical protein